MVAHALPAPLSAGGGPLARALLVGSLVALFVRAFVAAAAIVPTASMTPAIEAGDRVLVDRLIFSPGLPPQLSRLLPVREPRVGDVVWVRSPVTPGGALVKRIAALGGEVFAGQIVPATRIAVLGDRRAESLDSRVFGPLPRGSVEGRVCLILWSKATHRRLLQPVR